MGEGAFQALPPKSQQAKAARPADAPPIAIHRVARDQVLLPIPSSTIRFGDVAAHAHSFEIHKRLIAVIALVADDLFDAVAVGPHGLDLFGRFNQGLATGRRVSLVVVLHGHADDRARF